MKGFNDLDIEKILDLWGNSNPWPLTNQDSALTNWAIRDPWVWENPMFMCVCVCVCVYISMHVYVCGGVCVWMSLCCVCICVLMHDYIGLGVCVCVCVCVFCACVYHLRTSVFECVFRCILLCVCVCVCVCMCVCVNLSLTLHVMNLWLYMCLYTYNWFKT